VTALGLPALARFAQVGPLAGRVIAGVIMVVAGYQKLTLGPATFGKTLDDLGVPAPVFMGYVVTFTELFGGAVRSSAATSRGRLPAVSWYAQRGQIGRTLYFTRQAVETGRLPALRNQPRLVVRLCRRIAGFPWPRGPRYLPVDDR
jgi:DoxX